MGSYFLPMGLGSLLVIFLAADEGAIERLPLLVGAAVSSSSRVGVVLVITDTDPGVETFPLLRPVDMTGVLSALVIGARVAAGRAAMLLFLTEEAAGDAVVERTFGEMAADAVAAAVFFAAFFVAAGEGSTALAHSAALLRCSAMSSERGSSTVTFFLFFFEAEPGAAFRLFLFIFEDHEYFKVL